MDQKDIIIIGGGASVVKCRPETLHQYGFTIGVNDAALYTKCNVVVSMDRLWMQERYKTMIDKGVTCWFRECAWRNAVDNWGNLRLFEGDIKKQEMSESIGQLWGNNSGACAVNLAYHHRPKRIFLFGFDMHNRLNVDYYWYKPYEWKNATKGQSSRKLQEWIDAFDDKKEQFENARIDVFNVNPDSALNAFPKISYEDFLDAVR